MTPQCTALVNNSKDTSGKWQNFCKIIKAGLEGLAKIDH
jgi:hypothetical protein